ncbi:MAG: hypothetical protein ACJ8EE_07405, partial [Bradyrhizobium sp.]
MNRAVINGFAQSHAARRWFGQGQALALALASVSVVAIGRAEAACTTIGTTIDCTGTGNPGIGTPTQDGFTYHIGNGASITATGTPGIQFLHDATV